MGRKSLVLLGGMPTDKLDVVGEPVRVDTWYTSADHLITVAIVASNFLGRVYIDATFKVDPSEEDWFPLTINGGKFLEYSSDHGLTRETSTKAYNLKGRYVSLRARVVRSHLLAPNATPVQIASYGVIDRILLNV